jgi:hypothetical protein
MISAPEAKSLARRNNGLKGRLAEIDWDRVAADLDVQGFAVIEGLLGAGECSDLLSLYRDDALFRRHVIMDQHGYGRGEYKYFAYPCPGSLGSCGRWPIHAWPASPIGGANSWVPASATRPRSTSFSSAATTRASCGRRPCC